MIQFKDALPLLAGDLLYIRGFESYDDKPWCGVVMEYEAKEGHRPFPLTVTPFKGKSHDTFRRRKVTEHHIKVLADGKILHIVECVSNLTHILIERNHERL